jgi:hypothetical protein
MPMNAAQAVLCVWTLWLAAAVSTTPWRYNLATWTHQLDQTHKNKCCWCLLVLQGAAAAGDDSHRWATVTAAAAAVQAAV